MKRSWFIFLSLFFVVLCFENKAFGSSMSIGGTSLGDMARLEFSMNGLKNNISITQEKNEIIIDFKKKVYTNPRVLINLAPGYITDAKLSKDLTKILITTTQKYKLSNLILNDTFFLELIGRPSTDLQSLKQANNSANDEYFPPLESSDQQLKDLPSVPDDIYEKTVVEIFSLDKDDDPTIIPELNLDIDSSNRKTMFGFNWNKRVPFDVKKNQKGINIKFEADTMIDDADVASLLPKNLKQFKSRTRNKELDIFIPVPKGYTYRVSKDKNSTIVEVVDNRKQKATVKQAPKKVVKTEKKGEKQKTVIPAKKIETTVRVDKNSTSVSNVSEPDKVQEKAMSKIEQNLEAAVKNTVEKPAKEESPKKDDEASYLEATPTVNVKKELLLYEPEPIPDDVQEVMMVSAPVKIDDDSRTFSLSFPWSRDTAAALFKKQGYWWIVFDRKAEVDFSLLKRLGGDVVHEIVQLPNNEATIVRMIIETGYNPTVRKEGLLWIMDIVGRETGPTINLEIEPRFDGKAGARLFIPTNRVGTVQRLIDPLYGDSFTVVPVYGLGWGIGQRRSFPGVVLPETIQGVLVDPLSSGIVVKTNSSGIEITEVPNGLSLSSDAIVSVEEEAPLTMEGLDKLFDLSAYERETEEDFQNDLPNFLARAALARTPEQKLIQRLNLARFYLANNYIPETFAVLRTMEQDDFDTSQTPAFLAIQGMANVLFNRPVAAMDDLNREVFDESDMAKVWLAIAYAERNDFSAAQFAVLKKYVNAVRILPYDIKAKVAILAAKTAYIQEDEATMDTYLEMLIPEKNNPYQQAAFDYYKGLYHYYLSSFKDAEEYFIKAEDSPAQLYRALAGKELARLQFELDMISVEELAKRLERLRYAWRGDNIEYDTMAELVDIYIENEKYPEALRKMKEISEDFPKHPKTPAIKAKSKEVFNNLYLKGKSSEIDPITAIALFNEFKELVPKNGAGNEMITRLADRLVSVDLLENAAELLDGQLSDINVQGEERSAIGARLALIYLLIDKPEEATKALDYSIYFPLSGALDEKRTLIRAKALAQSGDIDGAIEILKIQNTKNANQLMIDIYWEAKDWENVSEAIKPLIEKPKVGKPISDQQAKLLLAWATSMRLANNETGLARLRENFITYMKNTPYYGMFDIISAEANQGMNVKNIANEVENVQKFLSFLEEYTRDLKKNSLSEMVKE